VCSCPRKLRGLGGREYEPFPAMIVAPDKSMTDEDVAELEELAELVAETGTCSIVFPPIIKSFHDHTGYKPTGAVKRIAASIEKLGQMGLHCTPQVVAMVLREYIKVSGRE